MDPYEPTNMLLSKIKTLDPENASKIMGYILIQDISERDLLRLALGPENVLQNVIFKAKTHLGLSANSLSTPCSTPSSPSPLNPLSRPQNNHNPFSQTSPRVINEPSFGRNPSPHSWPLQGLCNNGDGANSSSSISPKSSPFLSYDNIRAGSVVMPTFSKSDGNVGAGGCSNNNGGDFLDEYQLDDYFSFLDDTSSRNEELMESRGQLGSFSVSNGESHLHRRRFSESDLCFGGEDGGFGMGYRPCMYFARGFCKNGDNCKFVHSGFGCDNSVEINGGGGSGGIVGSPREMEGLFLQQQQQQEEMMRMKAAQQQQQRLAYSKYMNFLLQQQQNDPERLGAAAALMGDEYHKFGQFGSERNELLAMGLAEKPNSASRQIYLTFPADSTFKDEDVSNYFSNFGPVQDVRIPYQQKRMFGFVTFVHPETVRRILHRGNPHFICDSRVLVKPYKEKGKVANSSRRQLHLQQQLFESGSFSPSSSPSALSPRELYDLHLGARMYHNVQEVMLRRKLEEQSELQQAIEIQGRRLINLQLPDLRGDYVRPHQRSLSVGAPFSLHSHPPIEQNVILCSDGDNQEALEDNGGNSVATVSLSAVSAEENNHNEASTDFQKTFSVYDKEESSLPEGSIDNECQVRNVNHDLPNVLFTYTKSSGGQHEDISLDVAAVNKGSESENNAPVLTPSSNAASQ